MKINPGSAASSLSHPEIKKGDIWEDKKGCLLTVESYQFNRVTFYREGYLSPCIQPDSRFIKEFQPVLEVKP